MDSKWSSFTLSELVDLDCKIFIISPSDIIDTPSPLKIWTISRQTNLFSTQASLMSKECHVDRWGQSRKTTCQCLLEILLGILISQIISYMSHAHSQYVHLVASLFPVIFSSKFVKELRRSDTQSIYCLGWQSVNILATGNLLYTCRIWITSGYSHPRKLLYFPFLCQWVQLLMSYSTNWKYRWRTWTTYVSAFAFKCISDQLVPLPLPFIHACPVSLCPIFLVSVLTSL